MFTRSILLSAALLVAQGASATCISASTSRNRFKSPDIFDVGSTFGAHMWVESGLRSAADVRAILPLFMQSGIPDDFALVKGGASATLRFFGNSIELLDDEAYARRNDGSFTRKRSVAVGGITLSSGSITNTRTTYGPWSQEFFTAVQSYGIATARGSISGELGLEARGLASTTSGLEAEGRAWAALFLEGSAGVSVVAASAGLYAAVDLLEIGLDFDNSVGLRSGTTYALTSSYDAETLGGWVALRGGAFGNTVDVWSDSWNGHTISTTSVQNSSGCIN